MQKTLLFLAANPKETSQLNLEKEVEAVQQELAHVQHYEQFVFKQQWATTREALRHALLEHQPHIIHFSGHDSTQAGIMLENENGESQLVDGDTLSHFFEPFAARIECIILNACFSALQASHIVKYVDFVIGMNQPIKDKTAIRFAIGFYDALAAEKSIPTAFKLGRTSIQGTMPRAEEHLKPVLKQRFVNTHWLMPIQKNRLFTGRQAILHQLQNSLHFRQVAALSGVGGIGKTQTAAHYARQHRHEYRAVLWCLADRVESLNLGLVAIARTLDLPEKDATKQKTIIAAVNNWLATHTHWLLILDNVDDLKIVGELTALAKSEARHVLLTTCAVVPEPFAQSVAIHKMSRDEGVRFLLRRALDKPREKEGKVRDSYKLPDDRDASKDEGSRFLLRRALDKPREKKGKVRDSYKPLDKKDAGKLVDMLGALPLALVQAGAYIRETQCGLAGYLELYQTHGHALLQERGTLSDQDHPESVAITCLLSFEKITAENPTAIEVLRLCAFLHPDSIPEKVFQDGNILALDKALKVILKYSFVNHHRHHRKTKILTIHRLVQTILRHEMDEVTRRGWADKAVRAVNSVFEPEFQNGLICERLLPCAQTCATLIEEWKLEFEEAGRLLNQIGEYSYYKGNYESAKPLFERSLAIREKVLGKEHLNVANSLNNLAGLCRSQGVSEQAKPLYERALAIKEKVLGKEHPDVANSLNNLAASYYYQGNYEQAKPLYERSLAIKEKVLGKEHPDVATSLNNLAELYRTQGAYEQAKPLYERSLAIKEKVLGKEHLDVATSLNSLAGLYYSQGDYERVKPLFERSLAIHEKVFGGEHPLVATSLNNLALLYKTQGDYEQAKPLYERALKILNRFFQPDHPHVDTFLKNYVYATLLGEMKKPTTASKG
jgi:tetratricopeptide (TPR) repeat protein